MYRYCSVCGRKLTKTSGPIGPKCLQKITPRNRRIGTVKKRNKRLIKDIYGDADSEQREDGSSSQGSER